MLDPRTVLSALSVALAPLAAQEELIRFADGPVVVRVSGGDHAPRAAVSRDGGRSWSALLRPRTKLHLRGAAFDPLRGGVPPVPRALGARPGARLFVVQFHTQILDEYRRDLARRGVELFHAVPHQAFVARMAPAVAAAVRGLGYVRWIGALQPAWRLDEAILAALAAAPADRPARYDVVMVDPRRDRGPVLERIVAIGGRAQPDSGQGILQVADLTRAQVVELAHDDAVLWIEPWTEPGVDIDNARIQGGANAIEALAGFAGKGVTGMVMEGVHGTHVEFAPTPPFRTAPIAVPGSGISATPTTHGTWTAGEMFSKGVRPDARGLVPFAQMLYCNFQFFTSTNGRKAVTQLGVSQYGQMFETASWGYARTTQYTARSAEMDDIIFDLDVPIAQSIAEGPAGYARPQAWAKNIVTVGGVCHYDNADPRDDTWCNSATGPAPDGRIKPELVGYYDLILTTDGGASAYKPDMGGTSGATPIVAGYLGLTTELFASGAFGHPAAPGWQQLSAHRPHFTTAKALLVNTARQYVFQGTTHNLTRMHQGWGFPAVHDMLALADGMIVVDETHVLQQGQVRDHLVFVRPGTPQLRATMTYADPPAAPLAAVQRVNSLDLEVRGPGGAVYHGNHGLDAAMFSPPGGAPNDVDTLENVFVASPAPGLWGVRVAAPAVRQDGHVQTAAVDADYALVVSGVAGARNRDGTTLDLSSAAPGRLRVTVAGLPAAWTEGFTLFSLATADPVVGNGNLLGVELDALALACLSQPVGSVFHFPNRAGVYPAVPFDFPAFIAAALRGRTLDAVVIVADRAGAVVDVSNTDRVTVQ